MTNTYLARLPHRPEDAARMVREFSDAYWRLPSLALLRDFEARAPYRFLLPADTAGVVSLQRELTAEWREIKTKIEALHESAVQSLKRQVFGAYADL